MARRISIVDTISRLNAVAVRAEGCADSYREKYVALYGKVDELTGRISAADNDKFISQINGFKDDFQRIEQLMRNYAEHLRKYATALEETERQQTEDASGHSQPTGKENLT